jgi:hypothetical protein
MYTGLDTAFYRGSTLMSGQNEFGQSGGSATAETGIDLDAAGRVAGNTWMSNTKIDMSSSPSGVIDYQAFQYSTLIPGLNTGPGIFYILFNYTDISLPLKSVKFQPYLKLRQGVVDTYLTDATGVDSYQYTQKASSPTSGTFFLVQYTYTGRNPIAWPIKNVIGSLPTVIFGLNFVSTGGTINTSGTLNLIQFQIPVE